MPRERIVVLGAGLQGITAALLLVRRGHAVTLVDRAPSYMLRASLRNEGKIHLGFIFVNDRSFATSTLMLRAALAFAPVIEECLGAPVDWAGLASRSFAYVIPRDSMVSPDELLGRYARLDGIYQECARDRRVHYLGRRPRSLVGDVGAGGLASLLAAARIARTVDTAELALDLEALRRLLGRAVERDLETLFGHEVRSVARTASGFRVLGATATGGAWQRDAGLVVNCLWDGRLAIDGALGLVPDRKWVYRLKYRLLGTLPVELAALPSLSVVLGPYGDVVVYPRDRVYVSWYPVCMQGWSDELLPPAGWAEACAGRPDPALAERVRREALAGFAELLPGLERCAVDVVDAGVIFAWGATDIVDPASELHRRSDVGVRADDGYFSIDTGKLTCAPLFASELAAAVGAA